MADLFRVGITRDALDDKDRLTFAKFGGKS